MAHKVNPFRVLKNLSDQYESNWRRKEFIPSLREIQFQETLKGVIDDFMAGKTTIEVEEENIQLDSFADFETRWNSDVVHFVSDSQDFQSSEETSGSSYQPSPELVSPISQVPSWNKIKEAVALWRSTKPHPFRNKNAHLKLSTVQKRFSFVPSESKLFYWERLIKDNSKPKEYKLIEVETSVQRQFQRARQKQETVHDRDLFRWATKSAAEENLTDFKCSRFWLAQFKKRNRITNRRVTKFVSRSMVENLPNLVTNAEDFVLQVQELIKEYGPENTYNMDQSGFEKCLMSSHTLADTGSKSVMAVADSVAGTTHSYTVQPVISADGKFVLPLTICLQESDGEFGPNVKRDMFKSALVYPVASKSGKMGIAQLRDWFLNVLLPAAGKKFLLVVDSYTAHKSLIDLIPETHDIKILSIPAGTTGMIQPLDVHGFKYWKDLARYFTSEAARCSPPVPMYPRNSILKMQATIAHFLSSQKLIPFWRYAWSKCGYILEDVADHPSPMKICTIDLDKICNLCTSTKFVTCPRCDNSLCFAHCFIDAHVEC